MPYARLLPLPKHRDLFGALVFDPEAAALLGSYQVCGYFRVEPQKVRSPQRRGQCLQCCPPPKTCVAHRG